MDKTAEEIFQELQDHIIFLRDKVKQAELKHLDNVMSCGHGQYPKKFEIKTTARIYTDSVAIYSAHKKLLDLLTKHREARGNHFNCNILLSEMEQLICDPVLSKRAYMNSVFMEWQAKFVSLPKR